MWVIKKTANRIIADLGSQSLDSVRHLHVLPDFHGNRSPIGDPSIRGAIHGVAVKSPLHVYYYAVLLALCYGTKHIISSLNTNIEQIFISGGMTTNSLWLQSLADITNCSITTPQVDADASVLLGGAICARAAEVPLLQAMVEMSAARSTVIPREETQSFHQKKYRVFLELYQDQQKYRSWMQQ
jgi:ribulose kinase